MRFNPDIHNRSSIRLADYDYAGAGAYYVTICAWQRECMFGEITDSVMALNEMGHIVHEAWDDLPNHYRHIELGEFIVMPNHVHGVIVITDANDVGAGLNDVGAGLKPAPTDKRHGLPEIIRGFKTFSSRRINTLRDNPGCPVWQRNYYERVIRDDRELAAIREYIVNNPVKWAMDRENPANCNVWGARRCVLQYRQ